MPLSRATKGGVNERLRIIVGDPAVPARNYIGSKAEMDRVLSVFNTSSDYGGWFAIGVDHTDWSLATVLRLKRSWRFEITRTGIDQELAETRGEVAVGDNQYGAATGSTGTCGNRQRLARGSTEITSTIIESLGLLILSAAGRGPRPSVRGVDLTEQELRDIVAAE